MKVLLIEADAMISLHLSEYLIESGLEVVCAYRGEDGVSLALRELPDVIVLDLGLPDMHGLEVLERIGAEGLKIPVIVLTGMSDKDTKHGARGRGVRAYLEKPFEPRVLVARIRIAYGLDCDKNEGLVRTRSRS